MEQQFANDQRYAGLMRDAQSGDPRAYAELLNEITPRLRQIVRRQRRFLDAADIEDIVQDVLLSLHAVRATYDPRRPFMPWLLAITRNRVIDHARRYGRRAAHEVQVEELPVTFSEDATNLNVEPYDDPDRLKQAIGALPSGQRTAIEMLKVRELSLKEASAATGMSIGSLKVAAHRGMSALRTALKQDIERHKIVRHTEEQRT